MSEVGNFSIKETFDNCLPQAIDSMWKGENIIRQKRVLDLQVDHEAVYVAKEGSSTLILPVTYAGLAFEHISWAEDLPPAARAVDMETARFDLRPMYLGEESFMLYKPNRAMRHEHALDLFKYTATVNDIEFLVAMEQLFFRMDPMAALSWFYGKVPKKVLKNALERITTAAKKRPVGAQKDSSLRFAYFSGALSSIAKVIHWEITGEEYDPRANKEKGTGNQNGGGEDDTGQGEGDRGPGSGEEVPPETKEGGETGSE